MTNDTTISDTLMPAGVIPRGEVYAFLLAAEAGQPYMREVAEAFIEEIINIGMVAYLPTWGHRIKAFRDPEDTPEVLIHPQKPN